MTQTERRFRQTVCSDQERMLLAQALAPWEPILATSSPHFIDVRQDNRSMDDRV
jgi:hypothetical protein